MKVITTRYRPKVGDRVRIVGYSEELNGKIGFVTHVDGGEVGVRPRWRKKGLYVQLYVCEIQKVNRKARKS